MGGTGKTPQIEYLIRLLKGSHTPAILSRGYGRSSKGFIIGSKNSDVKHIGDEPMQFIRKFETITVAVDEKRCRGTRLLISKYPGIDLLLLDDAYQHRWINPGFSILLSNYFHPYYEDHVVPAGRLREFPSGFNRADVIIITKTPKIFSPITRRRILDKIGPKQHQQIFFSYVKYLEPIPLHDHLPAVLPSRFSFILLFTGIAEDDLLKEHLSRSCNDLTTLKFRDHHRFTSQDLKRIKERYDALPTTKKILITTEKDVMRLKTPELSAELQMLPVYYIPIEIEFHDPDKQLFNKTVLDYVNKNKRNSRIS
jgi:tetraacyldisaccharide 4'-kinase